MNFFQVLSSAMLIMLEVSRPVWGSDEARRIEVDRGSDVTLECWPGWGSGDEAGPDERMLSAPPSVLWIHAGSNTSYPVVGDRLLLRRVTANQSGTYECVVENETAFISRVNLTVRTEPPALVNVTVHASTILALILWNVAGDGGHQIVDFTAQYRSALPDNRSELEQWRPISPNHISPNSRQIDVYHLDPNASYWFRVWATNALGPGPPVEVLATTLFIDQDAELIKHFLSGVENFDVRTWMAAVGVVLGTLVVLAAGTCCVLCREWRAHDYDEEQDVMELVPNIILNPGFVELGCERRPDARPSPGSIIRSAECPGPGKPRKV